MVVTVTDLFVPQAVMMDSSAHHRGTKQWTLRSCQSQNNCYPPSERVTWQQQWHWPPTFQTKLNFNATSGRSILLFGIKYIMVAQTSRWMTSHQLPSFHSQHGKFMHSTFFSHEIHWKWNLRHYPTKIFDKTNCQFFFCRYKFEAALLRDHF